VVLIGQGVVWYSGQFWALYFLQTVKKLDVLTSSYIVGAALLIATPTLIFFGWLSDHIGRKPVILGGMLLASVTYYRSIPGSVSHESRRVNYPPPSHHFHPRVLRGMSMPRGGVLASISQPDSLHVSLRALSHRQRLGRRLVPFITSAAYLSAAASATP
jgi:hypothetical protein